ncbi:unnamed protein product [Brachionus calyciflorus]|uniref:Zinc-hook domain-containing protein n=1 Tax=Brachionus calyciflorus TaxID=104777 RepID=A0A814BT67_9BILA|nr:unnamed protein product [Brachionus calyciflorus]
MTIQGIRSYGPKEQDTQIIEFFTPVTLIVGQNGCGKTTVIECLKYATTSDMPPNTKGSSFLFDPKLIDEVETKGRIKLYFKDTSGLTVQVQKNMCSTQKAKKLEFRTLETIISRYNNQGKLASTITSKCINADAEVINAFGVSKAVLEHVIFCHQEDSNWPLSDGKLLKTRFDDIFAATKYIKALDTLKKIRLEKNQQIKQMEIERKHLETYKNRSEQLKRDSDENTKKLETLRSKKEDLTEKLKPVQKQLDFYFQESARIFEIKIELDKLQNEKELFEKQIKELLATTKDCLFTGTDEELEQYVQEYAATTNKMRREEEDETNKRIEVTKNEIKKSNESKSMLSIKIGALDNKYRDYLERKKQLNEFSKKSSEILQIENCDYENLEPKLANFLNDYDDETLVLQENNRAQESQLQSKIDSEREKKSKIDQSIQNKKETILKCKKQLESIEDELSMIQNDKVQSELNEKIKNYESEIESQNMGLIDVNELQLEIKKIEQERSTLKKNEQNLDLAINKWHMNSKVKTEINMLRNDKKSKLDQIRKIKIHIEEDLDNFFQDSDNYNLVKSNDSRLKGIFESECRELGLKLTNLENNRKDIDKRLCAQELKRKMLNDDLRSKENKLRNYEDKLLGLNDLITSESDIERFDSILEKLQEEQKNFLDEKGFLSGVDKTYKRFVQQLQLDNDDKHSCPVCMRCFKDIDEVNETISELNKYTRKIPQKVEDIDLKLKLTNSKLEQMINAKSIKESYDKIKNEELSSLRSQIENYDKNILPKLRSEMKENDEKIKILEKRKSYSINLNNEIILIDKSSNDLNEIDKKIDLIIKNNRLDESEDVDLESLNDEKLLIQSDINKLNKLIESKQDEISKNYARTDRVNILKEKLNECKTKRNELVLKFQKKSQLIDKQEELMVEINDCEQEIVNLNEKLKQSISLLKDLVANKESLMVSNRENLAKRNSFYNEIKDMHKRVCDLREFVSNFEKNDEFKMSEYKKEFKALEYTERELNSKLEDLYSRADEIKLEIARHEIKQRELNDNLQLREKRRQYELKKEQLMKKTEELEVKDKINLKDFKSEQNKLEKKRDDILKEISDIRTSMSTLEGRIQAVQEELNLDTIKNAMEKYMICTSDLRVLEYSVLDIEKYFKALDRAIMNYHQMKMSEINKIIKQLWRQVYRGVDIDYIEIRSEEESATEEQIKSRRTYNYRVVLIKGDACLDMRGRCSAGQKVLASIIIRLALAETFCLNSGILALDEPTTNLDRENIESLASALVDIIKARSTQKNFQLVIITHDEDFVEMLGRSEYMDQFYRVHKDEK